MGGLCGKPAVDDSRVSSSSREKVSSEARRRLESFRVKNRGEVRAGSIDKRLTSSRRVRDNYDDDYKDGDGDLSQVFIAHIPGIGPIPKPLQPQQIVAAGWPSWLVDVAADAIHGWLPRRADTFEKLEKIGQGTYSSVYKARDLTNNKIVALKRVRFDNMDAESVKFMAREILILRRLDHPNIIKLEGLVTSRASRSLYLVFEYMEHDLTGLASLPGVKFTEPQVKCYMQQLLSGLDHCHSHGVLHRDIKGSNLLIDNNGILKIADFGLASFFDSNNENVALTSRVVTLWYRPPELLLGATHYGVAVDLWSTGCILGELYAGKPIMPGRTEVEQLHKIFKLCGSPSEDYWRKSKLRHSTVFKPTQSYRPRIEETFKGVPSVAIRLMETLLAVDPSQRGTALFALKSEFFTTKPHACDPSSLPNYPPSKEIDAKLREQEARRQRAEGGNGQKTDRESRGARESRAFRAPEANAELVASMQRRHDRANSKSRSEYFNRNKNTGAASIEEQPRLSHYTNVVGEFHSGSLMPENGNDKHELESSAYQMAGRRPSQDSWSMRKHDLSRSMFGIESGRSTSTGKQQLMNGDGYKGNKKIHFSGPLGASNVDQLLKDHDHHIQEAARRARLDRKRITQLHSETTQNPIYVSSLHRRQPR
ncbi:hypothetical protein M8C21_008249 [Ambrosia artemisiifolia]|uniref:Protein kinase domain-containing protein n=1 Tax=Ambrosia artemisiifolia TaxID=4212 RepID=A0AAD5GQU9_AMBAR|nr:hypothetical protein M8C21_008249 [Ambrosia artemisiifolia]